MGTVCDISRFWINLNGLNQSSNLTTVETTMTHVFCMQGALKFQYKLLDIVSATVNRTGNPKYKPKSWIDRLVMDVCSLMLTGGNASFLSSDYLPKLTYTRQ